MECFVVGTSKLSFDQSNPSSSSCKSVSSQVNMHSEVMIHKGTSLEIYVLLSASDFFFFCGLSEVLLQTFSSSVVAECLAKALPKQHPESESCIISEPGMNLHTV